MHNYEIRDRVLLLEPNAGGGAAPSVREVMRVCVDRGTQGL
jgi:hypothetical protein